MENKLATHRRSVLHYLRAVTALEDYTSITRLNFKLSVSLSPSCSNPLRVTPWFYNQSPVLWHERRRGSLFSKSGLRFSTRLLSLFLRASAGTLLIAIDRWLSTWNESCAPVLPVGDQFTVKILETNISQNRKKREKFRIFILERDTYEVYYFWYKIEHIFAKLTTSSWDKVYFSRFSPVLFIVEGRVFPKGNPQTGKMVLRLSLLFIFFLTLRDSFARHCLLPVQPLSAVLGVVVFFKGCQPVFGKQMIARTLRFCLKTYVGFGSLISFFVYLELCSIMKTRVAWR